MAVKKVPQSAANADKDSLVYELARIVNQLQADAATIAAKLDADAGVTDVNYAAQLTADTLSFEETGVPS